jgi:hypothetical protein
VQRRILRELEPRAAAASAAATPAVLALLGGAVFQAGLSACCPTLAGERPAALLALLEAEVAAAELTHNFNPVNDPAAWENDVSVAALGNASHFYNLWELAYLGLARKQVSVDDKDGEVNLLGFPRFTGKGGARPGSLGEAAQRPVYTTVAMLGSALGNPTFGGVAAVFSNRYARARPGAQAAFAFLNVL